MNRRELLLGAAAIPVAALAPAAIATEPSPFIGMDFGAEPGWTAVTLVRWVDGKFTFTPL